MGMDSRRISFGFSVPVRTGVEFLPGALRSLARQPVPLEVALLDASGDPRVAVLTDAYAPLLRYRRHTHADAGQSAAIQEGWDRIGGEVLGWLNADDRLIPGALAAVAAEFAAHPETDVVYGHAVYVGADGGFRSFFPSLSPDPSALRASNIICQPACFVRRAAIARVRGLDTALRFTMDWDLWLRLFEADCRFRFLDRPLAVVIDHGATKTNSGGAARYAEIDRILRRHASLGARVRAQLGHRRTDAASSGGIVGVAVEAAMRLAGAARGRRRAAPVNGIEPETNRVARRCRIPLVWDGDTPPREVRLRADPPGPCRLCCNGVVVELSPADPTASAWSGLVSPTMTGLYEVEIEREKPWRLSELRLIV
jgi:hypothetical protein